MVGIVETTQKVKPKSCKDIKRKNIAFIKLRCLQWLKRKRKKQDFSQNKKLVGC